MSQKNLNPSNLDRHQMDTLMYDQEHDAQRVVIVADIRDGTYSPPVLKTLELGEIAVQQPAPLPPVEVVRIERIEVPVIVKEIEIKELPVPFIQERTVEVEKKIFIEVPKIVEIEKQVFIDRIEYREIEKPIVIEKHSSKLDSLVIKMLVLHGISALIQIAFHFIK